MNSDLQVINDFWEYLDEAVATNPHYSAMSDDERRALRQAVLEEFERLKPVTSYPD
jgi:hypothetical protein